jgi:hypothetical protein
MSSGGSAVSFVVPDVAVPDVAVPEFADFAGLTGTNLTFTPVAFSISLAALTSRAGGVPFLLGRITCVASVILPSSSTFGRVARALNDSEVGGAQSFAAKGGAFDLDLRRRNLPSTFGRRNIRQLILPTS